MDTSIDIEQHEQYRLLVDVTNAVISQNSITSLLHVLMKYLSDHFSILELSLLNTQQSNALLQCYYTKFNEPLYSQYAFEANENIRLVLEKNAMTILQKRALDILKEDTNSLQICKKTEQAVLIPLISRNTTHGFMLYGLEKQTKQFGLLEQISARVALAANSLLIPDELKNKGSCREFVKVAQTYQDFHIFDGIISQSESMKKIIEQVAMVANCNSTVLILGETGTGKELIAQAIHKMSDRHAKPMVKMNCSAVPTGLFESELFGHERGAFTGAVNQRVGRFEQANKSTLFLDEIGEIPIELQSKLLRVLQENEIERVGRNHLIPVDVRIVAATNANLLDMIEKKLFRSDLYYRLNIFPLEIPALRERLEDIPLLINYFTCLLSKKMGKKISKIYRKDMLTLSHFDWPGNVRQLRNFIERCVILTCSDVLYVPRNDLIKIGERRAMSKTEKDNAIQLQLTSKTLTKEIILETLRSCNGIVAGERGAAKKLGLKRTTLIARMQKLGITSSDYLSAVNE